MVAFLSVLVGMAVGYVIYQACMWALMPSHRCRRTPETRAPEQPEVIAHMTRGRVPPGDVVVSDRHET